MEAEYHHSAVYIDIVFANVVVICGRSRLDNLHDLFVLYKMSTKGKYSNRSIYIVSISR